MKNLYLILIILFSSLFAIYEVGEQISTDDQNIRFEICNGDYPSSTLKSSDFNGDGIVDILDIVQIVNYILPL